ncbi:Uncharacterised protein [Escherichia coli]|nr:Uncharacterised protein [Escherichia coli]
MAEMVTVGCKLPNGLVLEVGQKRVQVAGWRNNAVKIVGGYGLTQVDKVFFDAWLAGARTATLCEKWRYFCAG